MTAQVPAVREKPPILAGGQVAALIPQSLDEAFRVANAIAASGLAPKGMDKPEQVLVAIMAGAELGFAPFQSMQSFAVINGKPSIWGDAIPALLWSRGFDIDEWFDDDDNATKAFCKITRPSGKVIERSFSIADARKASLVGKQGPWQTNQKRMLQMRARAFCARDGAADILRGMPVYEEVQDHGLIRDVTPQTSGLRARLEANKAAATEVAVDEPVHTEEVEIVDLAADLDAALDGDQIPDHDTETGEIIESDLAAEDEGPDEDDEFDVETWARGLIADTEVFKVAADIDAFFADPVAIARYERLNGESPTIAKQLEAALKGRRKALVDKAAG